MKKNIHILLIFIFGSSVYAQEISLLEYHASNLHRYPKEIEMNIHWKKSTERISLYFTMLHHAENAVSTPLLKGSLNSRLMLVDSFSLFDEFGDKMITGYFKDTVGGLYEQQPVPFSFYGLGGIKSGEFKTYSKTADTARAELFVESVTNYLNGEKNGRYVAYYKNSGQIQFEYHYLKNKLEAAFTQYYKNGTFLEKGNYHEDRKHGEWTTYYENNQPARKEIYENGKLNGQTKIWHKNGKLAQINWYENDLRHGYYYTYYPDGKIKDSLFFVNGQMHGRCVKYHPDGIKSFECTFDNGREISERRYWNEKGILIESQGFKEGKKDGAFRIWNDQGKLIAEKFFVNDLPDGVHKSWYDNGKLSSKTVFKNGKQFGNAEYYDENGVKSHEETPVEEEMPMEIIDDTEIDQQEIVNMYDVWENPALNFILAPTEEGKKAFEKIKGLKFIITVNSKKEYVVSLSPDNADSKKGKKALPLLQTAFQVTPLTINGTRYQTTMVFTME